MDCIIELPSESVEVRSDSNMHEKRRQQRIYDGAFTFQFVSDSDNHIILFGGGARRSTAVGLFALYIIIIMLHSGVYTDTYSCCYNFFPLQPHYC
jgi:hypothetical protein